MTGVEILAAEEVACAFAFNWFWFFFGFFSIIIGVGFLVFISNGNIFNLDLGGELIAFIIVILFVGSVVCGLVCGNVCAKPTDYETQYKVTIDDSVSMNEFNEKYEIIDQEGKIYTVRERENKND